MDRMKILAAIVTHNRKELLGRCLDSLQDQRLPPATIVVIDNASTDGTVEMLAGRSIRSVRQANVGSAGGWHRAIEIAIAEGFDAVWLMDDDGFPDRDALAQLVPHLVSGVACASSVVLRENDRGRFVFPFPKLDSKGEPVILGMPRKMADLEELGRVAPDGTYPFAHLFNGALVATWAARAVGNVERGFFIFGDEVDYFFRLRAAGTVMSVLAAHHYHPDVSQRPYTPAKVYYYVKNTLILNQRYFNHAWVRHAMAVVAAIWRTARRNGVAAAGSYLVGRNAPVLARAVGRGLKGEIGKDFDA